MSYVLCLLIIHLYFVFLFLCMCEPLCMCVCVFVCLCVSVSVCVYVSRVLCVCLSVCVFVSVFVFVHVCLCMSVCICVYVCVFVWVCVCLCMSVCLYVCLWLDVAMIKLSLTKNINYSFWNKYKYKCYQTLTLWFTYNTTKHYVCMSYNYSQCFDKASIHSYIHMQTFGHTMSIILVIMYMYTTLINNF